MKIYPPVGGGSATTDASLLTSGTLPLARLSGITTTELDAAAGIVSGQIAGLSLSKLTAGTLIPSLVLDYGSGAGTGTVTAGNNQILNTSTGIQANVQTGKTIIDSIDGTAVWTAAAALATSAVPISWSTNVALTAGNYTIGKHSSTQLGINVPTGSVISFMINGANQAAITVDGLLFQASAGTVTAGARGIYTASTGLSYNVETGTGHSFRVNDAGIIAIGLGGLVQTAVPIKWTTNVALTATDYAIGKHSSTQLGINVATSGTIAHLINAVVQQTFDVNGIALNTAAGAITAATRGLYQLSTGVALNVPTGTNVLLTVNGVTQATVGVNGMQLNTLAGTVTAGTRGLYTLAVGLRQNVETGTNHGWMVNGVTSVLIDATSLTLVDATNIVAGTTTGTKICTATSQKLGFWNATPIVQPAGANQAAITDSTGGTAGFTLSDVGAVPTQANINNNFASLNRQVDAIRTALVNAGLIKGAA